MTETPSDRKAELLAAFEATLTTEKLILPVDERETLFEGYVGLQILLQRLPRGLPMAVEPATIALAAGGKVVR